jgi:hypothetical protein
MNVDERVREAYQVMVSCYVRQIEEGIRSRLDKGKRQ